MHCDFFYICRKPRPKADEIKGNPHCFEVPLPQHCLGRFAATVRGSDAMPKKVQKRYLEPTLSLKWFFLEQDGEEATRKDIAIVV